MRKEDHTLQEAKRILVRSPNWIGDAVMSLPALMSIKSAFPTSEISILAKPWVADIFKGCSTASKIILYESPGIHQGLSGKMRLAKKLKEEKIDLAILFPNSFESALITYLARIPKRAGYNTDGRGLLLTYPVPPPEKRKGHQIDYYLKLVNYLGFPISTRVPLLKINAEQAAWARQKLVSLGIKDNEPLVGMAPGSSYGPAKEWPVKKFAELSQKIIKKLGARIIVLGGQNDRELAQKILASSQNLGYDLTGQTSLVEAMALMVQCRLIVTNDSGLMHVAAALQVPLVAIFGSTDPSHTGPVGKHCRVIRKALPCSPCFKKNCPKNTECLEAISVEEVYREVEKLWNFTAKSAKDAEKSYF
ncbi:MAG: lipopolysaccharide heptosyltransferase II [bacterium]